MSKSEISIFEESLMHSRRNFIKSAGVASFSATAVAILGGCSTKIAMAGNATNQDLVILNTAIAAEHEAVAAYQVGAESGLLSAAILNVAVQFQGHHKEHIDALSIAIKSLGGSAVDAKSNYHFPVEKLTNENDVLQFAAGLERML